MGRLWPLATGAALGLLAAMMMSVGLAVGTLGAMILASLTQLPLFIAGLWLGTSAAIAAGVTGAVIILGASGRFGVVAVFAMLYAVPVALLVRQALLARPREDGSLAWYPPGLLMAWLTAYALAAIGAVMLLSGGPEALQASLRGQFVELLELVYGSRLNSADADKAAAKIATVSVGAGALSWTLTTVINGALAQGLLVRFGASWRPSPSLVSLSLPAWPSVVLGVACAAILLGGAARFIGISVIFALLTAFCLAGLAVLHAAVRRLSHPVVALVCFYMTALVFIWPFLVVAVFGLLESWLGLRRRLAPQGVNIDG